MYILPQHLHISSSRTHSIQKGRSLTFSTVYCSSLEVSLYLRTSFWHSRNECSSFRNWSTAVSAWERYGEDNSCRTYYSRNPTLPHLCPYYSRNPTLPPLMSLLFKESNTASLTCMSLLFKESNTASLMSLLFKESNITSTYVPIIQHCRHLCPYYSRNPTLPPLTGVCPYYSRNSTLPPLMSLLFKESNTASLMSLLFKESNNLFLLVLIIQGIQHKLLVYVHKESNIHVICLCLSFLFKESNTAYYSRNLTPPTCPYESNNLTPLTSLLFNQPFIFKESITI